MGPLDPADPLGAQNATEWAPGQEGKLQGCNQLGGGTRAVAGLRPGGTIALGLIGFAADTMPAAGIGSPRSCFSQHMCWSLTKVIALHLESRAQIAAQAAADVTRWPGRL